MSLDKSGLALSDVPYMDASRDARTFFINVTSGMLSYIRAVDSLCRPAPNDIRDRGPHQ